MQFRQRVIGWKAKERQVPLALVKVFQMSRWLTTMELRCFVTRQRFQVGGRLAQLGSRLVVAATRKIADEFFNRLTNDIDDSAERIEPEVAVGFSRKAWFLVALAGAVLVAVIWWLSGSGTTG